MKRATVVGCGVNFLVCKCLNRREGVQPRWLGWRRGRAVAYKVCWRWSMENGPGLWPGCCSKKMHRARTSGEVWLWLRLWLWVLL